MAVAGVALDRRAARRAFAARALPFLLLFLEVLVFHRLVLFRRDYVMPWDIRGFHLPHAYLYTDAIRAGELPLWDPYTYCGRPFQANIQTMVFYPATALAAALGAAFGEKHLLYFLEWNVALHTFLAGCFAFLLARRAGLRRSSALLAGTAYELGGYFAAHAEHMGSICASAWLPLAWFAVLGMRERVHLRDALLLAASLALAFLSGLTPLTAVVFATSLLLAFLLWIVERRSWRIVAAVAAACAASLLLAAVQVGPTLQLTTRSIAQYRMEFLGAGGGVPTAALVSLVLPNHYDIFDLSKYRYPFELTFMYLYCGWAAVVFAAFAAARSRTRLTAVFLLMLVLTCFAMLGDRTPIWRALYGLLPVRIRAGLHPEFTAPAFLLSFAVLAGIGLERAIARHRIRWAIAALAAVDLILVSSARPMNAQPLAGEPGVSRTQFEGRPGALFAMRRLAYQTFPPSRIDTIADSMSWAMAAPITQVPSANGNDPLALSRLAQVRLAFVKGERWGRYYEVSDLRSPILGMLNVRYLLSREKLPEARLAGSPFTLAAEIPYSYVYENRAALPRLWLVSRVLPARTADEAARRLRAPDFDPAREAIVESASAAAFDPRGTVRITRYGPNGLEAEIDAAGPAFLATSEVHYPGWRAWVDGKERPIQYTNVAFRGLALPPGRHTLRMQFSPPLLWWSLALTAAAWLAWLGCYRRTRR